jgi:transcriptional regulator of met regulon
MDKSKCGFVYRNQNKGINHGKKSTKTSIETVEIKILQITVKHRNDTHKEIKSGSYPENLCFHFLSIGSPSSDKSDNENTRKATSLSQGKDVR